MNVVVCFYKNGRMSFKYESCIEKKEASVLKDISVNQLLEFRPGCRRLDVEKRLKTNYLAI